MTFKHTLSRTVAVGCFAALTAACSGGGGSSAPAAPVSPEPKTESAAIPDFAFITDLASTASSEDSASSLSFNVPIPTLNGEESDLHLKGDFEFSRARVVEDGLGPAFNSNSCVSCHNKDGRGSLPILPIGQKSVRFAQNESLLIRISIEDGTELETEGPKMVPGFSAQLYHRGVFDLRGDSSATGQADVEMSYKESKYQYPDGEVVKLRKPVFTIVNPYDQTATTPSRLSAPDVRIGPRIGAPMIGLGLLELVPESEILKNADPDDKNGDGISGRPNYVYNEETRSLTLGRFGWKANAPSMRQQVAAALSNDMGVRSSVFPKENIDATELFLSLLRRLGDALPDSLKDLTKVEATDAQVDALTFYSQTLAVPKRRDVSNPDVQRGAQLFAQAQCVACHTPKLTTSNDPKIAKVEALRGLTIYPFSDELLHDMGDELSDGRRDFAATGREWKTRPLWGIGMTQTINPRAGFLHDGRARTIEEAILYHGGEAAGARLRFAQFAKSDRQKVLLFLKSL